MKNFIDYYLQTSSINGYAYFALDKYNDMLEYSWINTKDIKHDTVKLGPKSYVFRLYPIGLLYDYIRYIKYIKYNKDVLLDSNDSMYTAYRIKALTEIQCDYSNIELNDDKTGVILDDNYCLYDICLDTTAANIDKDYYNIYNNIDDEIPDEILIRSVFNKNNFRICLFNSISDLTSLPNFKAKRLKIWKISLKSKYKKALSIKSTCPLISLFKFERVPFEELEKMDIYFQN